MVSIKGQSFWKSEKNYAYVKDLDFLGCAWELLRRLPKYREDWENFLELDQKQKGTSKSSEKKSFIYRLSEIEANADIGLPLSKMHAKKWFLLRMKNPEEEYTSGDTFRKVVHSLPREIQIMEDLEEYFTTELIVNDEGEPQGDLQVVDKNHAVVVFDLSKGLGKQWEAVKDSLQMRAKAAKKKHPKVVEETLISYLRMLDACGFSSVKPLEAYAKIYGADATVRANQGPNELTKIAHEKMKQALKRAEDYKDLIHHHYSGKSPAFPG